MSAVTYPRKGEERQLKVSKDRKCKYCAKLATRRVCVEWSWFRGDDEVVNVCNEHSKWKHLQPQLQPEDGREVK